MYNFYFRTSKKRGILCFSMVSKKGRGETYCHIRNKRHKGRQMSSLFFWLFLHSILSGVVVTICSGHRFLLTEIEWRISQNNNDNICLLLCLLFLICFPLKELVSLLMNEWSQLWFSLIRYGIALFLDYATHIYCVVFVNKFC